MYKEKPCWKGEKPCTEWKNNNLMRHYGFFKLVSWQPRPGPSGRDAHVHSPWRAKMLSSPQSLDEQISLTSLCAKSSPRLWRPGTGTWFFLYPPIIPQWFRGRQGCPILLSWGANVFHERQVVQDHLCRTSRFWSAVATVGNPGSSKMPSVWRKESCEIEMKNAYCFPELLPL